MTMQDVPHMLTIYTVEAWKLTTAAIRTGERDRRWLYGTYNVPSKNGQSAVKEVAQLLKLESYHYSTRRPLFVLRVSKVIREEQ